MEIEARTVGWEKPDPDKHVLLKHVVEDGTDRSGLTLETFTVVGSRFNGCRFDKLKANNVTLGAGQEVSVYTDCAFSGLKARHMAGGFVRFERCAFTGVDIRDWRCFTVEMIDCTFTGRLRGGFFNGTVPAEYRQLLGRDRNEFHSNDFSQAVFGDVDFRTGIDLTRQRLPTGEKYLYLPDAPAAIAAARSAIAEWADEELAQQASFFLSMLDRDVRGGQQQLFVSETRLRYAPKPGKQRVVELLREVASE